MRFSFPRFPAEFEIPDALWVDAGMSGFKPSRPAFRSTGADLVALDDIEPLFRLSNTPRDGRGFRRAAIIEVLKGFVGEDEIPPIDLLILPSLHDISGDPFKYRVLDGYHRFYGSIAAGFGFVPATTRRVMS